MYKVFKDDCLFILTSSNDIPHIENAITICISNANEVKTIIEKHCGSIAIIIIAYDSIDTLINVFESGYINRVAAGGWVYNDKNELLMINRFNHWDIPKGHVEEGESLGDCAIREVMEETGIVGLSIIEKLGVSRHLFSYEKEGEEILKITHWYKMKSNFNGEFNPQLNEGITEVKWVAPVEMENIKSQMWKSLVEFNDDRK